MFFGPRTLNRNNRQIARDGEQIKPVARPRNRRADALLDKASARLAFLFG